MDRKKLMSRERSLLKAVSFRVLATILTMVLVYAFTGELALMIGIGLADFVLKIVLYYVHERAWGTISFGKASA